MIVITTQGDGPCGGIPVAHQLHDAGGLLDVVIREVRRREDRRGAACDERILGRIERRRISERVRRIRGLRVGATHLTLERHVLSPTASVQRRACLRPVRGRQDSSELGPGRVGRIVESSTARNAGLRFDHRDGNRIGRRATRADEGDIVGRHGDRGRLEQGIDHVGRRRGVASRHARLVADEIQQLPARAGHGDAIHRVVRILAGVVLRHAADDRPVRAGSRRRRGGLRQHASENGSVGMPQETERATGKAGR